MKKEEENEYKNKLKESLPHTHTSCFHCFLSGQHCALLVS